MNTATSLIRFSLIINQQRTSFSDAFSFDAPRGFASLNGSHWNVTRGAWNDACLHNLTRVRNASTCADASTDLVRWDPTTGLLHVCVYNASNSSNSSNSSNITANDAMFVDLSEFLTHEQLEGACRESQPESGRYSGDGLNAGAYSRPTVIVLSGRGFAHFDSSIRQRSGSTSAESTRWSSDSTLSMRVAQGSDHELSLIVTVTQQLGSASQAFTYDLPALLQPRPSLHPPYASAPKILLNHITVVGKSYGSVDMSVVVVLGNTRCSETTWRSDSSVQCRVSDGVGVALPVAVRQASHAARILETIHEASFEHASISASSRVKSGLSMLTLRMRTNSQLRAFVRDPNLHGASSFSAEPPVMVVVEGLVGSLTPSGRLALTGRSAHLFVNSSSVWNQTRGELLLEMAPGNVLDAHQEASVAFELRNAPNLSQSANATVRVLGALQVPPRGQRQRLEGEALRADVTPKFDVLFVNYRCDSHVCHVSFR